MWSEGWGVVQLIECLSNLQEALVSFLVLHTNSTKWKHEGQKAKV